MRVSVFFLILSCIFVGQILLSVVAEWVAVTLHVQVHSRFVTLSHTELQEYFLTLKEQFLTPRPSAPQSLYHSLSLAHFTSRSLPKNLHSKRRDNKRLLKHSRKTFKRREGGVVVVLVETGIGEGCCWVGLVNWW